AKCLLRDSILSGKHSPKTMAEQGRKRDLAHLLLQWYDANARVLPWRVKGQEPYKVWLSEIMLQQTTVAAVKDYYVKFIAIWPTVAALAAAPLDDVLKAWAGLGYYARARNLHACARVIAAQNGLYPRTIAAQNSLYPRTVAELQKLPGIGPYTAAAIAAIAYDTPVAAVDGNVDRVVSRYFGIEEPLPLSKPRIRELAQGLVPQLRAGDFAQAMMDLGATICTPKSPACGNCPWVDDCVAKAKGLQAVLPRKAPKKSVPTRYGQVYWITDHKGRVLVRQRPMTGLLAGMTEFPSQDWNEQKEKFQEPFKGDWKKLRGVVEHTFTHFHLEMTVWAVEVKAPVLGGRFVDVDQLPDEALPSVMRKVAAHAVKLKAK
ncbi:MAG: A/G-specific adenine glycosylase, partial [Aestuariivirga sp.]